MPSSKVANTGGSGLGEGEWICQACGNLNHAGRTVCNMRKCAAPKPEERWTCFCGNENYAGRLVCNLRKCGMLKPGLKLQDLAKLTGNPALGSIIAGIGGGGGPPPAAMQAPAQKPAPPGSWKCVECGNVNFPSREVCNGRNGACALPRATADVGEPESPPPAGTGGSPIGAGISCPIIGASINGTKPVPKASGPMNAPAGSWVCKVCNNVNFPTRTTCNSRNCGLPRDEVDGGPPSGIPAAAPGGGGGGGGEDMDSAPTGSWKCNACGNINWPGRSSCNRRSCGLPRST